MCNLLRTDVKRLRTYGSIASLEKSSCCALIHACSGISRISFPDDMARIYKKLHKDNTKIKLWGVHNLPKRKFWAIDILSPCTCARCTVGSYASTARKFGFEGSNVHSNNLNTNLFHLGLGKFCLRPGRRLCHIITST